MTGFNPWPRDLHHGLSVRCVLWKGVDNLLNHTLSPAGTSGGTDKGSYWTRLGLQPTQVIQVSTNNITTSEINHHSSSLTMLCRAYSSRRGIRDKLVSTQDHDFPGFLPVCKRSSRGWSKSVVYPCWPQNNSKVHSCTRPYRYINYHILQVTRCCDRIKTPQQNIMPEFRNACLQEYAKDALIGSFPFPPKILFCKIHK